MSLDSIPRMLGRYVLYDRIAAGGMASVHMGRIHGAVGFSRVVAIKRLHGSYAQDPRFVQMFVEEARLAALVKHPNVVSTLDVVADAAEVFLVMELVLGESLERLIPPHTREPPPPSIAAAVVGGLLEGLHAAHETRDELGRPLSIVHRDVSPHNVLVDRNGVVRVFDFGIAKASDRLEQTCEGVVKGKVAYMAPEQVRGDADRRADVFASGIVLWELLTGNRRQTGRRNDDLFLRLATGALEPLPKPSAARPGLPPALDTVVERATASDPAARFATARDMALALERAVEPASPREVASWLREVARSRLDALGHLLQRISNDDERVGGGFDARRENVVRSVIPTSAPPSTASGSVAPRVTSLTPASSSPRRPFWPTPLALLVLAGALFFIGLRLRPMRRDGAALQAPPSVADRSSRASGAPRDAPGVEAPAPPLEAALEAREDSEIPAPPSKPREVRAGPSTSKRAAAPPVVRASSASTARTGPGAVGPPAKVAPSASNVSCESPFVVGADGIRQIKPECM